MEKILVYILLAVTVILIAKVWRISSRLKKIRKKLKILEHVQLKFKEKETDNANKEKYFQTMRGVELDFESLEQKIEEERERLQVEVEQVVAEERRKINETEERVDNLEKNLRELQAETEENRE